MPSFTPKKMKEIDINTKYAVYGWIRKAEKELSLMNVPVMLQNICCIYFEREIFVAAPEEIQTSDNNRNITKTKYKKGGIWCSHIYGWQKISSLSNVKCRWDLKIRSISDNNNMFTIGISSGTILRSDFKTSEISKGYSYQMTSSFDVLVTERGQERVIYDTGLWEVDRFKTDDIISVILDVKHGKLQFEYNNQALHTVKISKGKGIEYRLMVIMRRTKKSVELLKFSKE